LKVDYRLTAPIRLHARFEIRGFTALLGRSGAGKTSLLKALAGLLPATGSPWQGMAPEARPVGYLPQGAALFPHLTALGNVAYPLRAKTRHGQARALLAELGIEALAARPAAALSGGEAQRVALARALACNPEILLLDEPSAALDAATRDQLVLWLIDTATARGLPALAATHDPALAGLADWLVLLADGAVIQEGAPRDVIDNPGSAAAAALLGYQNIWEQDGATFAIRAEDVTISGAGMPATVISARHQGRQLRLDCALPRPVTVLADAGAAGELAAGAKVFLGFPEGRLKRIG